MLCFVFGFSIILWRFIHVVLCIDSSSRFIAVVFHGLDLLNHLPVERHPCCLEFWAVKNKSALRFLHSFF